MRKSKDVYKMKWSRVDKKKITLMVLIIVLLILMIIVIINNINKMKEREEAKKYEEYIIALQKQEEENKIKEEQEKERIRQERIPKLTDVGKENLENIYHSETKRAFLTFDDGPSINTEAILEILKKEKIPATFFVLGTGVEAYPDLVKRIYEEGHYVANHGYSHVYQTIYSSPQMVLEEFNRCNDLVRNAIGVPEYNSHLFRFPGGLAGGKYAEVKQQAKQLLNENNILNIDWNALNGDAETNNLSAEYEMSRLQETIENKNSIVVLMHDAYAKKVTAETLPQIISYLRDQGYEFKNFYEIIK